MPKILYSHEYLNVFPQQKQYVYTSIWIQTHGQKWLVKFHEIGGSTYLNMHLLVNKSVVCCSTLALMNDSKSIFVY